MVATSSELSDSLVHAIERQFPWIEVIQAGDLHAAHAGSGAAVAFMLVESSLLLEPRAQMSLLHQAHPTAVFAILQAETCPALPLLELLSLSFVRGVLPMDLKLDLWLSVLQVILQGGCYVPPAMILSLRASHGEAPPPVAEPGAIELRRRGRIGALTEREFEILELVSRGLQNKLIASRLNLSENTIKIHLHNIITKLGVHNRTQAAGLFRDHTSAAPRTIEGGFLLPQRQ
ncbi:response regulator transcription factor [Aureimonas sp. ME7]|uniref:helix-turn-helix transcriptional regulator n=1 Tax=Aureimonas sp. ME7 TaxID=2744252 RepID=UPI0015F424E9|nr:response regulator transcription factor [Aureimonas sp. ME7]